MVISDVWDVVIFVVVRDSLVSVVRAFAAVASVCSDWAKLAIACTLVLFSIISVLSTVVAEVTLCESPHPVTENSSITQIKIQNILHLINYEVI